MRRQLMLTVAASVSMVLLAMLVPLAFLLRDFALEDRLARVGLEVQATETVVSSDDRGDIAVYIATINDQNPDVQTTVIYPGGVPDIGPSPGEDARVVQARLTGVARVDDAGGGAEILVPVALGRNSGPPDQTPVIRIEVARPGFGSGIYRAWLVLAGLGLVLLLAALLLADRLGRRLVDPIESLAAFTRRLGDDPPAGPVAVSGPAEIVQLGHALNQLVDRVHVLLGRERERVSDLSHRLRTPLTALQLRIDSLSESPDKAQLVADLGELQVLIDQIVRESRRSEREGLMPSVDAASVLAARVRFWKPLADDLGRPFDLDGEDAGPLLVRAAESDLDALVDVLLDNVFTHTDDDVAVRVQVRALPEGGAVLVVEDDGPGFDDSAVVRGASGVGSTGLGLAIAVKTATESGGSLAVERSLSGGARVVVRLGPPHRPTDAHVTPRPAAG